MKKGYILTSIKCQSYQVVILRRAALDPLSCVISYPTCPVIGNPMMLYELVNE